VEILVLAAMGKLKNHGLTLAMGNDPAEDGAGGGVAVQEAPPQLKKPPLYKVVMLNDDYTPMEFVVLVLQMFFNMDREQSTRIMLTVHTAGRAICGTFTRDVAETKASQVIRFARDNEHPLLCEIEASEE